ncbi:hypothetical protein [Nitratireductor sp. GZWM139]|uniref:hypothetical protein n=1 Tax=Nitratireductor sp. GZWM139 TaxID=2950541 RepID=UPI0024BD7E27|nr:hypothetical protein [Nitratireductor sp. GZWM139]MDJ1464944.1 hypothetical protein [Nitratireductor sp. GZWM139]
MAKRIFSKVSPAVWHSPRFKKAGDDGRYLHLYFLTCGHQNSCGCCLIPEGYACADLDWPPDRYRKALQELCNLGLVSHDAETSEIYIERWFLHNKPMNKSHAEGTRRLISDIDSDTLREKVEEDFLETTDSPANAPPASENYGGHLSGSRFLRPVAG